jgi:hypothetical protein
MTPQNIDRIVAELVAAYGDSVSIADEEARRLVRITEVELYPTCQPAQTSFLLVLDPTQPKPQVFVKPGQLLANGRVPKNSSNLLIGGQTWMQFSFNIPWTENQDVIRFVAAARQRFSQNE